MSDSPQPEIEAVTRIGVTRAAHQNSELIRGLKALGVRTTSVPTIKIVPQYSTKIDTSIRRVRSFDFVVFTSPNGAELFFERLFQLGLDARALGDSKIAVVGEATFRMCERYRIRPDFIPPKHAYTGKGLLKTLAETAPLFGSSIALVRAQEGREELLSGLTQLGAKVELLPIYATVKPELTARQVKRLLTCTALTFTSPSAVNNLISAASHERELSAPKDRALSLPPAITIGPTTTKAAVWAGFKVVTEAKTSTVEGLLDAVSAWLKRN